MKKLNQKKVRWIVREMEKGDRSVYRIAKTMDITPRWVREIYRSHRFNFVTKLNNTKSISCWESYGLHY